MKYIKFILAVNLLLCIESTWACGGEPIIDVTDTPIYRIYENQTSYRIEYKRQFKENNIALWKEQTSDNFPDSLIEETIYHYSSYQLAKLYNVASHIDDTTNIEWANKYAQYLATAKKYSWSTTSKHINALRFLLLAKRCEEACKQLYNDPWYYPVKGDNIENTLEDIISNCRKATNFKTRYFLQEVRALIALNRYDECISRWEETKDQIDNDLFYKEIELRVARAYLLAEISDKDKAIEIYARYGDAESLMLAKRIVHDINEHDLTYVYNICPDAEYIKNEVQKRLTEQSYDYVDFDTSLLNLAELAIKERRAKDIALWYYVAASLYDKSEQYNKALLYIKQGKDVCNDKQMKKQFRILRILIESKTMTYTANYEHKLFNDLKWLDGEILSNLTPHIISNIKGDNLKWATFYYHRYPDNYYYDDAMRLILINNVIPKAINAGNTQRALQLANYADYRLLQFLKIPKTESFGYVSSINTTKNVYDYQNYMFKIANDMKAIDLEKYVTNIDRSKDSFSYFLEQGSFTDLNYWNELLGTKFMREHNYKKAVEYLEKVSPEYQYTLNVYKEGDDMRRDPFEPDFWERGNYLHDDTDYKLRFAQEMLSLQQTFEKQGDPNRRASAMIRYAIGMRNSVNYCWTLTRYENYIYWLWDKTLPDYPGVTETIKMSKRLIDKAFTMFTCEEIAARHRYMLRDYKHIIDLYPNTNMAQYIIRHCDTWQDYVKNKRPRPNS